MRLSRRSTKESSTVLIIRPWGTLNLTFSVIGQFKDALKTCSHKPFRLASFWMYSYVSKFFFKEIQIFDDLPHILDLLNDLIWSKVCSISSPFSYKITNRPFLISRMYPISNARDLGRLTRTWLPHGNSLCSGILSTTTSMLSRGL